MGNPVILGVNSVYHESSACVLRGREVVAIAEEERFNRRKHAKPAEVHNADQVPAHAIRDCLARARLSARDIDYVAYSFDPGLRHRSPYDEPTTPGSWGSVEGERVFLQSLERVPSAVGAVVDEDVSERWVWVPHELAHAASAYFASPFEHAAVLAIDGIGEHSTALLAHGRGDHLDALETVAYPNSLGFIWEKVAKFVGLDEYSAPKVMALAAFADPDRFRADFEKLVRSHANRFEVDIDRFRFRVEDYTLLEELFGARREPGQRVDTRDAEVAAALQACTEDLLFGLAEHLRSLTEAPALCVAGGVALNCVAMGRLLNEGPFEHVFVQPLAHDAGTALGAALWVAHTHAAPTDRDGPDRCVMADPYLGPSYDDQEVDAALAAAPVSVSRVPAPEIEAARLVEDGLIVGWFQGPAEVGPRALGNRTIVADPRRAGTKELINLRVKHREYFRPFAPAVLEEQASEWFDYARPSLSTRFMSFACEVRPEKRASIPAVVHVDGTSRPQTVSASINPRFHALISEFHRRTGVPLVVNTSFNTFDEPIVCSPTDAVRTFLRTGLDVLVIHDNVVRKYG
ncbi:MAG: carbamoyltransferase family protein [Acidimicrobiales bacterium]